VGAVEDLRGQAFAEKNKVRRELNRAAPVVVSDQIDTGSWSRLTVRLGRDTILKLGEANGGTAFDFQGNGDAAGDVLALSGYGPGATFTQVDATHWQVNYDGGSSHDVITFLNGGAAINPSDYAFI
jgi:hypothetical protein